MRIQHNIMAMNAYRNYNGNTNALSKNLEKLSSGYRINRAGDDAAGLAISEKMRGQITGLEAAQKNVKDGVSLVKTAEGAMQEIHDMLGRMKYLATQSANGTYDNEVDRANIQKEVKSLKDEIDRISDSANFNGQKLLDGSLSGAGGVGGTGHVDTSNLGVDITADAKDVAAVKGKWTLAKGGAGITMATNDKLSVTLNYKDAKGNDVSKTVTIKKGTTSGAWILDDGTKDGVKLNTKTGTDGTISSTEMGQIMEEALNKDKDLKNSFDIKNNAGGLTFEARQGGTKGAKITGMDVSKTDAAGTTTQLGDKVQLKVDTEAKNATKAYDFSKAKVWNNDRKGTPSSKVVNDLKDAIFEVNGKKFVFVTGTLTDDDKAELKNAGVEHWVQTAAKTSVAAADITKIVDQIAKETGLKVTQGTYAATNNGTFTKGNGGTFITFEPLKGGIAGNGGLKLQIGDTADEYNQMTVGVDDMHTAALGIADIDLSSQDGAAAAVDKITKAINAVSSTRGDLGAIQNRLEHTEKNLSVMQENIQQAESNVRDTDVAAEMMQYTKNNILIQSAQAMLAQANQVPQGVLQLLG